MCGICQTSQTFSPTCPYQDIAPAAVKDEVLEAGEVAFGDGALSAFVFERDEGGLLDNDTFFTLDRFSVDDVFRGSLTTNDFDLIRVSLDANVTYEISVDLAGSSVDFPVVGLFDRSENLIGVDDTLFDGVSSLIVTTSRSGTHFVSVTSLETLFPIGIPDNGFYRVTITEVTLPDPVTIPGLDEVADLAGNDTTTGVIEVGGTFTGFHSANDTDWIAVELTAGQTVSVDLNGFGTTPVRDTVLTVLDENGTTIVSNDDFGFSLFSEVTLTAGYTGTHYIQVQTFNQGGDIGAYQVRVFEGGNAPNGGGQEVFTNDQIATFLTTGFWEADPFTPDGPIAFDIGAGGTITVNLTGLTAEGVFLANAAMEAWSLATGLQFQTVTTGGMILFDDNELGAFSNFEQLNGTTIVQSIVNVSTDWLQDFGTTLDSYSFQTYIHEIGHAIGLGHAGIYNGFARFGVDNAYANDSWQATVMSYFSQTDNTTIDADEAFVLTPMIADILAVEQLYGLPANIRTGDTVYGVGSNAGGYYDDILGLTEAVAFTVVDNGGIDTIDFSFATASQTISLVEETFSDVGDVAGAMAIARGTVIEHFIAGSGDDDVTGNAADNMLQGGEGTDTLRGGDGADTLMGDDGADLLSGGDGDDSMMGGIGDDTMLGGAGADHYVGGDGFDVVDYSDADRRVQADMQGNTRGVNDGRDDSFDGIEQIIGSRRNDNLLGDSGDNILSGHNSSDRLFGRAGNDSLFGDLGNDVLYGNSGADEMTGGIGNDRFVFFRESESQVGVGNHDTITDFVSGSDRLEISRFDADLTIGRNQAFTLIGEAAFSGQAGELRFEFDSGLGLTLVQGDQNGDLLADFEIALVGDITLVERDFLL